MRGGNAGGSVITKPFDWFKAIFEEDYAQTLKKYQVAPANVKA